MIYGFPDSALSSYKVSDSKAICLFGINQFENENENTSSVSPELLQSQANICSRKSPFAHEELIREPWYFVKKPYTKFGTSLHFFSILTTQHS